MRASPTLLLLALLAVLLGLPAGARADDGENDGMGGPEDARSMLLGPATVLASPGSPRVLHEVLPGGKAPARLTWPLPDGPIVVLGLPEEDEVAQQVADAFDIPTDDLDGGYRIVAWRAERRPMVVVMAADACALAAARFEFDAAAPMEMVAPDMRSLDFKKPNQEAGVAVQPGTRVVRPRYAFRAWAPYDKDDRRRLTSEDVLRAAGARANRLWFRPRDLEADTGPALVALARAHGIAPVLHARMFDATLQWDADATSPADLFLPRYVESLVHLARTGHRSLSAPPHEAWQPIRHFAFELEIDPAPARPRARGTRGTWENRVLNYLGLSFFPDAAEMLVVPGAHADRLAQTADDIPNVATAFALGPTVPAIARERTLVGWSGPREYSTHLTFGQARARRLACGAPLVLLDRWAEPFQDTRVPYVPSVPQGRGREAEMHMHMAGMPLQGVVVFGHRGTDALLEGLWEPVEMPAPAAMLEELCPPWPAMRGRTWAGALAAKLRRADKENLGLLPWLAPLADALAGVVDGPAPCWVLPPMPKPETADLSSDADVARLQRYVDAAAAAFAARLPKGVTLSATASPGGLSFLVEGTPAAWSSIEPLLRIRLRDPLSGRSLRADWTPGGWHVEGSLGAGTQATGNIRAHAGRSDELDVGSLDLDRFALGGDLHAGRVLEVGLSWGPTPIWPPKGGLGDLAPWIVGPRGGDPLPPQPDPRDR